MKRSLGQASAPNPGNAAAAQTADHHWNRAPPADWENKPYTGGQTATLNLLRLKGDLERQGYGHTAVRSTVEQCEPALFYRDFKVAIQNQAVGRHDNLKPVGFIVCDSNIGSRLLACGISRAGDSENHQTQNSSEAHAGFAHHIIRNYTLPIETGG